MFYRELGLHTFSTANHFATSVKNFHHYLRKCVFEWIANEKQRSGQCFQMNSPIHLQLAFSHFVLGVVLSSAALNAISMIKLYILWISSNERPTCCLIQLAVFECRIIIWTLNALRCSSNATRLIWWLPNTYHRRSTRVHKLHNKEEGIKIRHWFIHTVYINVGQRHRKKLLHLSLCRAVSVSGLFGFR